MSVPAGSQRTRLVVIRGNSGSGKSSIATAIRQSYGRGLALVGQDNVRRHILKEKDVPDGVNIGLIDTIARYSLDEGYHVLIEGILHAERYAGMLTQLCNDHRGHTQCFYLNVSWEETQARHALRPQAADFGEAEMRGWYLPMDLLPEGRETIIDEHSALEETVELIMGKTGLMGP